jgi:hypothetical protein
MTADLSRYGLGGCAIDVVNYDPCTRGREALGDRLAHSMTGASDDDGLPCDLHPPLRQRRSSSGR